MVTLKLVWVLLVTYVPHSGDGLTAGWSQVTDSKPACFRAETKVVRQAQDSSTHRVMTECRRLTVIL